MKKLIQLVQLSVFAAAFGLITLPAQAEEPNLDFQLVNKTGYDIKEVYVSPSTKDEWEENILKAPLADGETLEVSFGAGNTAKKWDLKIVWVDGGDAVFWKNQDLSEISKISLYYNEKTDETSAKTE